MYNDFCWLLRFFLPPSQSFSFVRFSFFLLLARDTNFLLISVEFNFSSRLASAAAAASGAMEVAMEWYLCLDYNAFQPACFFK